MSYSWNELIEQYAPNFVIDKTRIAIHTMDDGNFYRVRNSFASSEEEAIAAYESMLQSFDNIGLHKLVD